MTVQVSVYHEEYKKGIVELLVSGFNGWPSFDIEHTAMEHWEWKYEDRVIDEKNILVALDDGNVVGCLHVPAVNILYGGKSYVGAQGCDLVINPLYRGQGIYSKMNDIVTIRDIDYSISSNPVVLAKARKDECVFFPKQIINMVKIIDIDKHLSDIEANNLLLKKIGLKSLKIFNRLGKKEYKTDNSNIILEKVSQMPVDYAVFWSKMKKNYTYTIDKDQDYVKWRYFDPRGGNYSFIEARSNDALIGFVVVSISTKNVENPSGYIVDLQTLPEYPACPYLLINYADQLFDDGDINHRSYMTVDGTKYKDVVKSFGYINIPTVNEVWFDQRSKFDPKLLNNSDPNQLSFQLGDTDWI